MLEIQKILEKLNVNFVFHPKSEVLPVDKIDIELIIENYPENLPNTIELIFVPGIEEATQGLSLLQFYATLNLKINDKNCRGITCRADIYLSLIQVKNLNLKYKIKHRL